MSDERLEKAQKEIESLDEQMAALFEKRLDAQKMVTDYRKEFGLPVSDDSDDARLSEENLKFIKDPDKRDFYVRFMKDVIKASRTYEHRMMNGLKVAYSGVEGAFAYIASKRIFPDAELVAYPDFRKAYRAAEKGECDVCVLPVENSYAGEVGQVSDLMFSGTMHVTGMYTLPVTHHLLGIPGAKLSGITKVISHPQALSQCDNYIKTHNLEMIEASNTAIAAKRVMELNDPTIAAIASMETAELNGMKVLDRKINESGLNSTRFAVFSRTEKVESYGDDASFLMLFTVNNVAGALANAINVISKYGFNMRMLRSRSNKDIPWQYYFFAEMEGDDQSKLGKLMLEELKEHCAVIKVVGRYLKEVDLKEEDE